MQCSILVRSATVALETVTRTSVPKMNTIPTVAIDKVSKILRQKMSAKRD